MFFVVGIHFIKLFSWTTSIKVLDGEGSESEHLIVAKYNVFIIDRTNSMNSKPKIQIKIIS